MLNWILTGGAIAGCLALIWFANWKASQPWDDMKPRILPWRFIMILAVFALILALVHAINLLGVDTGPDKALIGRRP
ncbi:MAG: hypothetical protein AAFX03_07085 [Pseudomonadota bacterium]